MSEKVTFSLTYSRYFDRFGHTTLEWEQYPGQPSLGTYEVYDYDTRYSQHDFLAAVEYHTGWHGLYLTAAREGTHFRIVRNMSWVRTYDGELVWVHPYVHRSHGGGLFYALGIGREWALAGRTYAVLSLTYSFPEWVAGPRAALSMRMEL